MPVSNTVPPTGCPESFATLFAALFLSLLTKISATLAFFHLPRVESLIDMISCTGPVMSCYVFVLLCSNTCPVTCVLFSCVLA